LIDEDTLDQINNNLKYLQNQSVDGAYMHLNNGVVDVGIKILCGRKSIPPNPKSDFAYARIGFAKMFTSNSIPVITSTLVSPRPKLFHTISGIGQEQPNHQGFEVAINLASDGKATDKLNFRTFLNWIAVGY
jgi:hypothetical protein